MLHLIISLNLNVKGKIVKLKCPHKFCDKTIKDIIKDLAFLTLITNSNISINKKHEYYTQIIHRWS